MKDRLLGKNSAPPASLVEVKDEAGLEQLFKSAQQHLVDHPEDGMLMIADFESFARDLGFSFSAPMLAHVRKVVKRDPAKAPKAKAAYDKLKAAGPDGTFELAAGLQLDTDDEKQLPAWSPQHMLLPNAIVNPSQSAGYGVLVQVSQQFCNDVIGLMFKHSAFRPSWSGSQSTRIDELAVNLVADYDVALEQPQLLFLQSAKPEEAALVGLSITATAKVALTVEVTPLSGASLPVNRERFEVEIGLEIAIESLLEISTPDGNGDSTVVIDLRNIRKLQLTFNGQGVDPVLLKFLEEALSRIVRKEVEYEKQISISHAFNSRDYGGLRVRAIGLRTLIASASHCASLSIGLDFNGAGDESLVQPLIPVGEAYAFILREEVFNSIWNVQKHKIPSSSGDVDFSNPRLVLMDGYLAFSIDASYEVFDIGGCGWVSWHINASARAGFAFESFEKDGIYYIRPLLVSGPDVDLDDWDEFLFSFLVGILLSLIGINWGTGSVIAYIVIETLIGKVEQNAANQIRGYSVGLRGDVPGTGMIALSTTPTVPVIFRSGITAHGGLAFRPK